MIESLRVPTNADKIYGHVVVPEGVEAKPRDAWTGEVEVIYVLLTQIRRNHL